MKLRLAAFVAVVIGALAGSQQMRIEAQAPAAPQTPAAQAPARGTQKPAFPRAADAIERVTWRTRSLIGNERLTNWDFAISGATIGGLTFLDSVIRADAAVVDAVEGSSTQRVSADIQKNLDHNLTEAEIASIRERMGPVRMLAYRVSALPADAATRRRVLQFAKQMGADVVAVPANTDLSGLDAIVDELDVDVAVLTDAAGFAKSLQGRTTRLGVGIDTGAWTQSNVAHREGLEQVWNRLRYVTLRDRSGRGANARNVVLGKGVGNLTEFFHELNRLNIRPLALVLDGSGVVNAPGDLFAAVSAFEDVVQPAYAANFNEFSKTRPIRRDLVMASGGRGQPPLPPAEVAKRSAEVHARIIAAIPPKPQATPKKVRRLLVIESLQGMSHNTIPHANVMIDEMGRKTGAWTTIFSNDLENLRYPKVKEYDAIFLNSIVGEFLPDPKLREDLVRYVREGGGLGGIHGTPWASRNWDEFAEMIGAQSAPHRIESGIMKVYDKNNPIVASFNYEDLPFREEYYRFEHEGNGRLRWDKVRVLLTVDLDEKVPQSTDKPWQGYRRPDKVYPVVWIRDYGKGRVFYNSLGHMPDTFMKPEIVGHFLAGIQYMLGDLPADATPNPLK
jgi:type 1 glutamine amidotransferase